MFSRARLEAMSELETSDHASDHSSAEYVPTDGEALVDDVIEEIESDEDSFLDEEHFTREEWKQLESTYLKNRKKQQPNNNNSNNNNNNSDNNDIDSEICDFSDFNLEFTSTPPPTTAVTTSGAGTTANANDIENKL